jgi:curved DNA-binding protein CbpA
METTIDPLKVLNLPKNYTAELLKENYKRLALKAHPDKGGSEYLFKLLTECYRYLANDLKKRESDKQFHELKNEFLNELEKCKKQDTRPSRTSSSSKRQNSSRASASTSASTQHTDREPDKRSIQTMFYQGSRFDQEKFNKFFTDNKLSDEKQETGYQDWMKQSDVKEAPQFRGSFNSDGFNSHFNKHAQSDVTHKQLIKYQEPEAMITTKRLGFTELGQESIDDYSGDNKSMKNLNFMDYRIAHTTSRIVDPRTVSRQDFKNIQELEQSRDSVSYQMTEEEYALYMRKKRLQEKEEEKRQMTQQTYDKRVEQHYMKLNGLLTMGQR